MRKFQKRAAAAAVCSAIGLGAAPQAQALTLGEPGEALLVPLALYDSVNNINTLVGVTIASPNEYGLDPYAQNGNYDTYYQTAPSIETEEVCVGSSSEDVISTDLHFYFFDFQSVHKADIRIPATCDDFVRIDWGAIVRGDCQVCTAAFPNQDGVLGYIVVSTNNAHRGWPDDSSAEVHSPLYGQAYLIQGDWDSEAFVPVVPMVDSQQWGSCITGTDNNGLPLQPEIGCTDVARSLAQGSASQGTFDGGIPRDVCPLVSGMQLDNDDGVADDTAYFSLRYFLDPALSTGTDFVVWFCDNDTGRNNLPTSVYNAAEVPVSSSISLPFELNIIDASTLDGVIHSEVDPDAGGGGNVNPPPIVNTGFVVIGIPETVDSPDGYGSMFSTLDIPGPERAGVAFSLIHLGAGANPNQVQTELAHERGVIDAP